MTAPLALGIDIGGTNTSFGIVNQEGTILGKGHISTAQHETIEEFVEALRKAVEPLFEQVGRENVVACGVGAPNANFYTGEIMYAPNLPWKGVVPLAKLLGAALKLEKVVATNDAKAAAWGELTFGAAKGMTEFIVITLGTGVGSGFVTHGQLIYGHDGFAGELGHVTAVRGGRLCGCGRHGCLETYTSATGIVRTAKEWLVERTEASLLRVHGESISAKDIFDAALQGDALAKEIFEYTGKILGQTLADAVAITSPEAIIFFGGLARAGDLILKPVKEHMEANLLRVYQNKVKILQSALPEADAAILGASALAW